MEELTLAEAIELHLRAMRAGGARAGDPGARAGSTASRSSLARYAGVFASFGSMTTAVGHLREEHRWIRLLLECLDHMVEAYRSEAAFDPKAASELQALLEHFVDEQHQAKEEAALIPKLLERVKRLQQEHAEEREHLDRMRFSLFNAKLGDPSGLQDFMREAQAYVEFQRAHMAFENLTLLPLAEQLLTKEDDEAVLAEFQRRETGGLSREEIRERVRGLCERLAIE